jgi:hypothetical protein
MRATSTKLRLTTGSRSQQLNFINHSRLVCSPVTIDIRVIKSPTAEQETTDDLVISIPIKNCDLSTLLKL